MHARDTMPAKEDGHYDEATEDGLKVSSSGTSSEFPHQMHTLHTAPSREDGAPDKAARDGHEVPSHGASSELPRLMHAQNTQDRIAWRTET